jgi:hypothetical protein
MTRIKHQEKIDCARAKAMRRGVIEQRPLIPKKRRPKVDRPFVVVWTCNFIGPPREFVYGRYEKLRDAENVIAKDRRRMPFGQTEALLGLRLKQ